MGLSPRVRGNRWVRLLPHHPGRSIPACAGEPREISVATSSDWVYPRVCGGTALAASELRWMPGLSPRVRGNLRGRNGGAFNAGVYPRVCGGTWGVGNVIDTLKGLSPRVRGNRGAVGGRSERYRSIPACAGEPAWLATGVLQERVYPRVCGGTVQWVQYYDNPWGLSPRVRGNRRRRRWLTRRSRSIPACAGEPTGHPPRHHLPQVYPRVCGGTTRPA